MYTWEYNGCQPSRARVLKLHSSGGNSRNILGRRAGSVNLRPWSDCNSILRMPSTEMMRSPERPTKKNYNIGEPNVTIQSEKTVL